jgi:hypothetical protein
VDPSCASTIKNKRKGTAAFGIFSYPTLPRRTLRAFFARQQFGMMQRPLIVNFHQFLPSPTVFDLWLSRLIRLKDTQVHVF